ncbi:fukutin-like protein [Sarcoptes scabiei]|uniref:Fukutin-like protein n=1 Tax=Sarcoptes scabiei TaxID=52283 RepID=A0A132A359_SARSC|nr:fukutin-like protein [Sarcoptes scabiei]
MVKISFVFILMIISAFLLTIQLIAFRYLIQKATKEEPFTWKILDQSLTTLQQYQIPLFLIDNLLLRNIENGFYRIKDFGSIAEEIRNRRRPKHNNRFRYNRKSDEIINDENQRSSLIEDSQSFHYDDYQECRIVCQTESKITHLATLSYYINQEIVTQLSNYLKDYYGLSVIVLKDIDSTLLHLNLHVTIITHIFIVDERIDLRKDSHVVHIAVFYERIDNSYWWQGPIRLTEQEERILHRQGLKRNALRLSYSGAIYEKTTILRTTIDGLQIFLPKPSKPFLLNSEQNRYFDCDLKRSYEFHNDYPKDESTEANEFRSKGKALLAKLNDLFENRLKLPFWLSSGTLLGYYRQCDFIVYSGDIDIGMWADDFREEIVEILSINNLPLIHWFGRRNDSLELSFLFEDIKLDIFFFYREKDHYWNGGTQAKSGLKFKYAFPKFTLCWTDFVGLLVRVPCETESYIVANYGKDWRVPIKDWDWKSSPSNVRPNGQWKPNEWSETIRLIPVPIL